MQGQDGETNGGLSAQEVPGQEEVHFDKGRPREDQGCVFQIREGLKR